MKQQENRAEPQEKQIRFIDSHYNLGAKFIFDVAP